MLQEAGCPPPGAGTGSGPGLQPPPLPGLLRDAWFSSSCGSLLCCTDSRGKQRVTICFLGTLAMQLSLPFGFLPISVLFVVFLHSRF